MTMHVLYIRSRTNPEKFVPKLEPNDQVEWATSTNFPFGVVLHDSTEADRLKAQIAIAELCELDSADDLKWVEVKPV